MFVCYNMSLSYNNKNTKHDEKYHIEDGYPKNIQKLIQYLPDSVRLKTNSHSRFRIDKSDYLKKEDINDESVSIHVPQKIPLDNKNNKIFEVKTVYEGNNIESIFRLGIRLKNVPVKVNNTDNNYDEYEYCFIISIDPQGFGHAELITVYLNHKNDMHNTRDKSVYTNA